MPLHAQSLHRTPNPKRCPSIWDAQSAHPQSDHAMHSPSTPTPLPTVPQHTCCSPIFTCIPNFTLLRMVFRDATMAAWRRRSHRAQQFVVLVTELNSLSFSRPSSTDRRSRDRAQQFVVLETELNSSSFSTELNRSSFSTELNLRRSRDRAQQFVVLHRAQLFVAVVRCERSRQSTLSHIGE